MLPIQITLRSVSESASIEEYITKHFKKLAQHCQNIQSCRIVIDATHKRDNTAKEFSVSLDITVPGNELAIHKHDDNLFIAIKNSFAAIEKVIRKHDKSKKIHAEKPGKLHQLAMAEMIPA